jgi:hypothetical protein
MRMRLSRTLPVLCGLAAAGLLPSRGDAQTTERPRQRLLPYHMLIGSATGPAATGIRAQTPFVPYYGKNRVRYDKFGWEVYKTDHFEIYFYPQFEKHLERVAGYAESAYQHISADLKHDLGDRVPLVLYKTQSEFQEQNISGDELPEGVLAFAEPERNRMVLPIDEAPDQLYALITHELTHIFEFSIIPRGIVGEGLPLWVDEGLADYMTGSWNALDLMAVRDTALTDNVPKMSHLESAPLSGRTPYSLGHATFEFIEARWGKEGLRQFLFSLRKHVLGGGESAYEEALKLKAEDFDDQFDRYLKERFKPFRDKERPADYGRDLAPSAERTPFVTVVSVEPSPSGDMIAAVAGNRRDQELDILLLSAKDGQIIRNLTTGFDKDRGFEYIAMAGGLRGNLVPWIAWAPVGDLVAYFARTEKTKTLVVQNIVSGETKYRFDLKQVDAPESPAFSPDGKTIAFAAISQGVTDIYGLNIETGALTNLTRDDTANYAPAYAPDGRTLVYTARIAGTDKLFQIDLASGEKRQITFGSHDDTGAKFFDDHTLVFTSTAVDPKVTLSPEVARNGNIPNVWTLDLRTGELRQLTDTLTGNVSPVVLHNTDGPRVAFVTYYKGENGIHTVTGAKPITTVASEDFGAPGPIFDFTAPISHTLVRDNIRKKGAWEKLSLAGRPPVSAGITSSGNIYGNTSVTFTDVLGDKEVSFFAQSVAQYRTTALSYFNRERRLQYALQGFSQDLFYYGQNLQGTAVLYDPSLGPLIDRDLAEAVQSQRGGTAYGIYPFNRYARLEVFSGYIHMSERYTNGALQQLAEQYQIDTYGRPLFRNGHMIPLGVSFIKETTVFRDYGPVAGSTLKLSYEGSPGFRDNWISRQTVDADGRYYKRLAANGVLALRLRGLKSFGQNPDFLYFGGNSEMRGYEYLEFIGQKAFFADAELRFPLIEAMLTPLGVLGGLRGVFFANLGAAGFNNAPFTFADNVSRNVDVVTGYELDGFGQIVGVQTQTVNIGGLRLVDGRASYGLGLESFLLGFPMHFDWSWKTLLNKDWEDTVFRSCAQVSATFAQCTGNGAAFRKMKFDFWIGYDF